MALLLPLQCYYGGSRLGAPSTCRPLKTSTIQPLQTSTFQPHMRHSNLLPINPTVMPNSQLKFLPSFHLTGNHCYGFNILTVYQLLYLAGSTPFSPTSPFNNSYKLLGFWASRPLGFQAFVLQSTVPTTSTQCYPGSLLNKVTRSRELFPLPRLNALLDFLLNEDMGFQAFWASWQALQLWLWGIMTLTINKFWSKRPFVDLAYCWKYLSKHYLTMSFLRVFEQTSWCINFFKA